LKASKLVRDTFTAAESLSELPDRGRLVSELSGSKYREIFVGRYRLIYRVGADYVAIMAFVHGARDFRSWWRRYRGGSPN
jgi:plasmid stabilization system protein ParE